MATAPWHSRNVMLYTDWVTKTAGWSEPLRNAVKNAAMLHDLGKIGVPDGVLMKPSLLTPDEAAVIRQVPLITCKILEPLRVFETETLIVRHLRERFDGSGYPDGLAGDEIPIGSRLLAVTEAFDSITCDRAHRAGRSLDAALAVLGEAADEQFDPRFVELIVADVAANRSRWQKQIARSRVEMPLGKRR